MHFSYLPLPPFIGRSGKDTSCSWTIANSERELLFPVGIKCWVLFRDVWCKVLRTCQKRERDVSARDSGKKFCGQYREGEINYVVGVLSRFCTSGLFRH